MVVAIILIVDNEPLVVGVLKNVLEKEAHRVYTATSERQALGVVTTLSRVDLLIVNHLVNATTGRKIAECILETHPEAKVMHISCYSQDVLESEEALTPVSTYLAKPFRSDQVSASVNSVLGVSSNRVEPRSSGAG